MTLPIDLSAFQRDVLVSDGRAVTFRPALPSDVSGLERLYHEGLSDTSEYYRFFGMRPHIPWSELELSVVTEPKHRFAMMAEHNREIIATATYVRDPQGDAEVAFAVADSFQKVGIGTLLLEDLAIIARAAGFERLVAETLPGNLAMLHVFRGVGLQKRSWLDAGTIHVEFDLTVDAMLEANSHSREWAATTASLAPLLRPNVVAVVGVSGTGRGAGSQILSNIASAFPGQLYAVHPTAKEFAGCITVSSLADISEPIDIAVIAVPAEAVTLVAEECGRAGVRVLLVVSAGFAEQNHAGVERQARLLEVVRRYGMRLIGPNCLGVISSAANMNATFSGSRPRPGSIAFASQSGGLGIALLEEVAKRGIGISSFVSLGNKADVSGNDLLCAWGDDPDTRVVLLYLESIGRADRFDRIAQTVARTKPVVALKGGRSAAGARGARSHTAAMATPAVTSDAIFEHAGVTRAENLQELLDLATYFDLQPLPAGRRVALVGNAGGLLVLAADACEANDLSNPELSTDLRGRILQRAPHAASTANPVDLLATISADRRNFYTNNACHNILIPAAACDARSSKSHE